ncbi:hypothetical protein [Metabacillus fastidiosus]|uniref:hypothetical protein n=1 Tax=Metabacillus fastidiosus TaxID=1458 RepID=UPI003D29847A
MKKLLFFALFLALATFLSACGDKKTNKELKNFNFTVEDLENRIEEALKQMGSKTNLKIILNAVDHEGNHTLTLSNNIEISIQVDSLTEEITSVTLVEKSEAFIIEKDDSLFAFLLLVGTVDVTLSFGERNLTINELEVRKADLTNHTKSILKNDINYTIKGTKDQVTLQATPNY